MPVKKKTKKHLVEKLKIVALVVTILQAIVSIVATILKID